MRLLILLSIITFTFSFICASESNTPHPPQLSPKPISTWKHFIQKAPWITARECAGFKERWVDITSPYLNPIIMERRITEINPYLCGACYVLEKSNQDIAHFEQKKEKTDDDIETMQTITNAFEGNSTSQRILLDTIYDQRQKYGQLTFMDRINYWAFRLGFKSWK